MTIVESAKAALIVAERMFTDGLVPVPQTSGSKGIQLYAARPALPEQGRLGLRQAAERDPGQGVPGLLHRHHVRGPARRADLRRLQPEPGRAEHHRALLDARPGGARGGHPGDLGRAGRRTWSRRPALQPRTGAGHGWPTQGDLAADLLIDDPTALST